MHKLIISFLIFIATVHAGTLGSSVKKAKKPSLSLSQLENMYFPYLNKISKQDAKEGVIYVKQHLNYQKSANVLNRLNLYYAIYNRVLGESEIVNKTLKNVEISMLGDTDHKLYKKYFENKTINKTVKSQVKKPPFPLKDLEKMYFPYMLKRISKQDAKEAIEYLKPHLTYQKDEKLLNRLNLYYAVYIKVAKNRVEAFKHVRKVKSSKLKWRDKRIYNKYFGRKLSKRKPKREVATKQLNLAKTISLPKKATKKKPTLSINRLQYMYFDYIDKSTKTDCKEAIKYIEQHFGVEKDEKKLSRLNLYAGIYAKKLGKLDDSKKYFAKIDFSLLSEKEIKLFTKYRK